MSEINCFGDEIIYGKVVPGWCLVRLVNSIDKQYFVNGIVMKEGHLGLTHLNDPSFVFAMDPIPWNKEWEDSEEKFSPEEMEYWKVYEHYRDRMKGDMFACHNLVEAYININTDYSCLYKFYIDRMVEVINKGPIKEYRR